MHVMMHVPCRANDVQVEFTMLDPHVRATLKPDNKVRMWDMRRFASVCFSNVAAVHCSQLYLALDSPCRFSA